MNPTQKITQAYLVPCILDIQLWSLSRYLSSAGMFATSPLRSRVSVMALNALESGSSGSPPKTLAAAVGRWELFEWVRHAPVSSCGSDETFCAALNL